MRIAACMVMIPRFEEVFIHRTTGELRAVPAIVNPSDENALEMALAIKENKGAEVVAVSCGEMSSESILRKAIAAGCDHAYLLADERFAGSDPLPTAKIVGEALKKIKPDLVACGSEALNGGQTGPRIAECLGVPHYIEVTGITMEDSPTVKRVRDGKEETLALRIPSVLAVRLGVNTPRTPKAVQIIKAHRDGVLTVWGLEDLGLDASMVGARASSTKGVEVF